jgi:hypothetical protein
VHYEGHILNALNIDSKYRDPSNFYTLVIGGGGGGNAGFLSQLESSKQQVAGCKHMNSSSWKHNTRNIFNNNTRNVYDNNEHHVAAKQIVFAKSIADRKK